MGQNTELQQQTTLRQHLSPQQVRFVRMLEMTGPEIEEEVRRELDDNPALEVEERGDDNMGENASDEEFNETSDQILAADYESEDDTPGYLQHVGRNSGDERDVFSFDQNVGAQSVLEQLNSQLDVIAAPTRDIALARYLLGYLDANGRLSRSVSDIANDMSIVTGKEINRNDLMPALNIIRYELEPPGLGAVDLRECLLIQLRRRQPKTEAVQIAEEIISDYFDVFTKKHFERLQTLLGVDKTTLEAALGVIRSLDPKPGNSLNDGIDAVHHITPDFIVTPVEGEANRFSVALNQHLPELEVEETFRTDYPDSDARLFIKRKREEATTFIGLLRKRSETLMTVMKAIVTVQKRFFETEDKSQLRPMILNDLSEMTGLDKSVISRATSNKYVATPTAVYPLKMFFSDTPTDDADTSASEIIHALQEIIEKENKKHPLSDRALTEAINAKGYPLARRTVTKYREKLGIPVARLRKEY
ncbi:MAG: RNA polymerase factor sigma-54 [Muribaculaceae bacterium]|nr:RNA polymerase factor sigma-54 [Muribaculaceae bacterium]